MKIPKIQTVILSVDIPEDAIIMDVKYRRIFPDRINTKNQSASFKEIPRPTDEEIAISSSYLAAGEYKNGYETGYFAALNEIFNPQGGGTK